MSADDIPVHEHTFSSAWTTDDTYHWHAATCEHTKEISGKAAHSWDSGVITTVATCGDKGVKTYTCSVCGKTKTEKVPATGNHVPNDDHLCTVCGQFVPFVGPTGGYVFYDCDADNDSGNADGLVSTEVGWRYLEAAPADLRVVNGVPTVDSNASGYSNASTGYYFGYYRTSDNGSNLYVNGTTAYNAADCTGTAIGAGKTNTQLLVNAMGAETYSSSSGSTKTGNYAARLCDILAYTVNAVTYDDWFLPSRYELNLMYVNLSKAGLGGFADIYYWSSSEGSSYSGNAWGQSFGSGSLYTSNRLYSNRVRAVRAFMNVNDIPVHEHTFSSAWTTDDTYHWHAATCEHTEEVSGKAEHTFSDWVVTREATQSQTGLKTRACSVCGYEESEELPVLPSGDYVIGDIGPAGGYIFYDCDADNASGNADGLISTEVGWRYLEAAPADLRVVAGVPTVDSSIDGYSDANKRYVFGFYRTTDNGSNLYVNGTTAYNAADCTGTAIGAGKTNTQLLVNAMGAETYASYSGSSKTADYAAKLCNDLTYTVNGVTYDDWFLPSRDELDLMYSQLFSNGLGGFADNYYWSSSEYSTHSYAAWKQYFYLGGQYDGDYRDYNYRVRAVRAF